MRVIASSANHVSQAYCLLCNNGVICTPDKLSNSQVSVTLSQDVKKKKKFLKKKKKKEIEREEDERVPTEEKSTCVVISRS